MNFDNKVNMLLLYYITSIVPKPSMFFSILCDFVTMTVICDYYTLNLGYNKKKRKKKDL